MTNNVVDVFDIHSESVLAIRRTVIIMSVLLLSFDYRYIVLPETLSVYQVQIRHITSWHIYATTIALLSYVLVKYLAKLREIYSKPNSQKVTSADYWIEFEKSLLEKHFNSQLLSYLDKKQLGLQGVREACKNNISHCDDIRRIEIKSAQNVQALKGGKYFAVGNGIFHCLRNISSDQIIEYVEWQGNIGPVLVSAWRRYLMKTRAWLWYIFSDHFVIDYFPIIFSLLALAKFVWLSYEQTLCD